MAMMDDDKRAKLLTEKPKITIEDAGGIYGSDRLGLMLEQEVKRYMANGVPADVLVRRVCRDCHGQWIAIRGTDDDHKRTCFIRTGEYI